MKINNRQAFTLIEALMTVTIFAVMLGGVYASLQVGTRSWTDLSANLLTRQELRRGLTAVTRDLRQASDLLIEKTKDSVTVNFRTQSDGIVSYSWSSEGQNADKIIRKNYDKTRTLANGISKFEIVMTNNREVDIALSADVDGRPMSLNEKIAFRMKTNPFISSNH